MKKLVLAGLMAATAFTPISSAMAQQRDQDRVERRQNSGAALRSADRGNRIEARQENRTERRDTRQAQRADRREWRQERREVSRDGRNERRSAGRDWRQERGERNRENRQESRQEHRENLRENRGDWNENRRENRRDWRETRRDDRRDWRENRREWREDRRDWQDDRRRVTNRWSGQRRWNHRWRDDRRYDWRHYRHTHRHIYRAPRYHAPRGWDHGYTRFSLGIFLGAPLYGRHYWIDDPWYYRLPPAHGHLRWVRYYDDALLVDIRDGYIVDVIYDFFY